jgi:hypothetical protein
VVVNHASLYNAIQTVGLDNLQSPFTEFLFLCSSQVIALHGIIVLPQRLWQHFDAGVVEAKHFDQAVTQREICQLLCQPRLDHGSNAEEAFDFPVLFLK